MSKLKKQPVTKSTLIRYLDSSSDFSFELKVLKMLREHHLDCEHGGSYDDAVTGKPRQFDIRAIQTISRYRVRLAVECKNIRDYFPVLVSCTPRHADESYHHVALIGEPTPPEGLTAVIERSRAKILHMTGDYSIYKVNEPVGKATAQVGRGQHDEILANDGELYEKWSQALSSSVDLVSDTYWDSDDTQKYLLCSVIPIIVMPNGNLWTVFYDDDGSQIQEPALSDRCSCFVDKAYELGTQFARSQMMISHIELMTLDGLQSFVESHLESEEGIAKLLPLRGLSEAITPSKKLGVKLP